MATTEQPATSDSEPTATALPTLITIEELGRLRQIRMLELDREFRRQMRELKRVTKAFGAKLKQL